MEINAIAAAIFLFIYSFIGRPYEIAGQSMAPSFVEGQFYFAFIRPKSFERGDVVVFTSPQDSEKDLVKRIVGMPHETVSIKIGEVYINGNKLDESTYKTNDIKTYGEAFLKDGETIIIPENMFFVLGDNRSYSQDSREWGFVPLKNIIGTVRFCYYNCFSNNRSK